MASEVFRARGAVRALLKLTRIIHHTHSDSTTHIANSAHREIAEKQHTVHSLSLTAYVLFSLISPTTKHLAKRSMRRCHCVSLRISIRHSMPHVLFSSSSSRLLLGGGLGRRPPHRRYVGRAVDDPRLVALNPSSCDHLGPLLLLLEVDAGREDPLRKRERGKGGNVRVMEEAREGRKQESKKGRVVCSRASCMHTSSSSA